MTDRWIKRLINQNGNGLPLAAAVSLCLLMIMLGIMEYSRLMIISSGVKDAMQEAVISVVNDNYNEIYHSVREGYAAGYEPWGGSFEESVDEGDVYGRLGDLLGLDYEGSYLVGRLPDGKTELKISQLSIEIPNSNLAPTDSGKSYEVITTVRLEVPVSFLQKNIPDMSIKLRTKAAYTPKF